MDDKFKTTVIAIVLSALGAIIFQMGKFALVDYGNKSREIHAAYELTTLDLDNRLRHENFYEERLKPFEKSSKERNDFINQFLQKELNSLARFNANHDAAIHLLDDAYIDRGKVLGLELDVYSPSYKKAILDELDAEMESLTVIASYTSRKVHSNRAIDQINAQISSNRLRRLESLSAGSSSYDELALRSQDDKVNLSHARDKMNQDLRENDVRFYGSGFILIVSGLVYLEVLRSLYPKKNKEQAHHVQFE